ncbi:hypothetical protein [Pseudonocardia alaniniphila]|uniref:Antibiotic biosynthesis monooxygenase n=1 Tax=Pseudonocardia alaniniphila TaxID=75291 RepID=A0ABS9TUI6_9PSEU|nr:hypothetical protein [Pseudonocardia alaniniphila]MCH6172162.1 hypothetical protein [Pseudonocardia alaniniphila]
MFLGAYHFDGHADDLLPAYHRLLEGLPPGAVQLQLCVGTERGLTVFDTCPSRAEFAAFSGGDALRAALAAAGLPQPRVEQVGDVQHSVVGVSR